MSRLELMRRVVLGLSALWAVVILVVFALRLTFPLELEWMEDGALHQALRLQQGEPIYGEPGPDFVPYLYTPLYPMLLAVLGAVLPLGFVLGRLVSIVATLATCLGLWRLVGREGKPRAHQAFAVGLFLSGYVFTFRWLDLARIDSTFLALTLWGLLLLREGWGDRRKVLLAGVLMGLAFWTKQTTFVFILASGLGGLLVAPRQLWIYVVTIAAIGLGGVAIGNAVTDGWLWIYIYELHQTHAFNAVRFREKTWGMFAHAAPFLVLLTILVLVDFARPWLVRSRRMDDASDDRLWQRLKAHRGVLYWGVLAAAGLLVSALGYSTQWAEPNAFIPGVCFGAAFLAVALPVGGGREQLGLGLVAAQLSFALAVEPMYQPIQDEGLSALGRSYAWQDPSRTIPTGKLRKQATYVRGRLESTQGEVLALHRPWWNVLAGGTGHVGAMGLNDVPEDRAKEIKATIRARISEGAYEAVWLEGEPPAWLRTQLGRSYRLELRLQGKGRARPMSGYMSEAGMVTPYRKDQLLFTKPAAREQPPNTRVIADFEDGTRQNWQMGGRSFGHGPVRSVHRKLPPVGPVGGEYLLSSAAMSFGLEGTGEAWSPDFELPRGGQVQLLLGATGPRDKLTIELVDEIGERRLPIEIPKGRWKLRPVKIDVPDDWAGTSVYLRLLDEGEKSAIFIDDLWVVGP